MFNHWVSSSALGTIHLRHPRKNVELLHPLHLFLSVWMGPNWAGAPPPTPERRNLGYQHPHPPLVFLQKVEMQKENQNAVYRLVSSRTRHLSVWNTYSRTRHLSATLIAEPDTCLEHCLDSNNTYTNYSSGHLISVNPLPLPPCNHPLPSEFLPFFTIFFEPQ